MQAPAPSPVVTAPLAGEFAGLPELEKDILKKLWNHQQVSPVQPGMRWGFRPNPNSPDLMAFEVAVTHLAAHGWVGTIPQSGAVYLTAGGNAYCQALAAEIDAYQMKTVLFRPADPANASAETPDLPMTGEFGGLPEKQKDILKTLWEHQKVSPGQRWSFRPAPNNPNLPDFTAATAGLQPTGWVGLNPQTGGVYLTDNGRAFCQAHESELDAYSLKPQQFRPVPKN
jgi:hypothetical protein